VALVHDFLIDLRGAERVFSELCRMWPEAEIFTPIYDARGTDGRFEGRTIHTSFLQRLRPTARTFRSLLPLYPSAIESFDFSGYDLVLSSSSAWAHAVLVDEGTTHVCYCHNPFRYAWNDRTQTLARQRNPITRAILRAAFHRWRQWDWIAAQRTDRYIANSRTTQGRIRTYFGREASIIHPPVETDRFTPGAVGDHYAVVSELMAHKRIDVAVEAFNQLGRPLTVVGDGPELRHLRRTAGQSITFTGRLDDHGVAQVMQQARALVISSVEEFGLTAVEAQAAGRPVIALGVGGALETVRDGVTGRLWTGTAAELAAAVREFDDASIDPRACVENAASFDTQTFRAKLRAELDRALTGAARAPEPSRRPLATTRLIRRAARNGGQ